MKEVEKFEKKWRNFAFGNSEAFVRCVNCKHFLDCLYYAFTDQSFDFPKYCPHFEKREKTLKIEGG